MGLQLIRPLTEERNFDTRESSPDPEKSVAINCSVVTCEDCGGSGLVDIDGLNFTEASMCEDCEGRGQIIRDESGETWLFSEFGISK